MLSGIGFAQVKVDTKQSHGWGREGITSVRQPLFPMGVSLWPQS